MSQSSLNICVPKFIQLNSGTSKPHQLQSFVKFQQYNHKESFNCNCSKFMQSNSLVDQSCQFTVSVYATHSSSILSCSLSVYLGEAHHLRTKCSAWQIQIQLTISQPLTFEKRRR
ncbi:hypothetical protein HHI36_009749 [Cryptolaemus montrouzieri]|uniref:Uncharacterized protein n=1 Tax=Cryptolaemus montrouzieri TaxID=559131 RepID=A0ABD2MGW8_9CUCU